MIMQDISVEEILDMKIVKLKQVKPLSATKVVWWVKKGRRSGLALHAFPGDPADPKQIFLQVSDAKFMELNPDRKLFF
jgi:hypothetical protein